MSVSTGSSFDSAVPPARHRPPRDCPVCSHQLDVTQLGCSSCGTGLSGRFRPCEFCGLDDNDRDVLRVFLASRGNMKDLERHLGVSYPTARARFDDLLRKLGLVGGGATREGSSRAEVRDGAAADKLETLRALAKGDLGLDDAKARLAPGGN
jgi:hypothetical protein